MEILSERSSRVVSYAKLHRAAVRRTERQFLVEGANSVTAALESGHARLLLVREADVARFTGIIDAAIADGTPIVGLTDRAAQKLSDATTPPGVFALCTLLDADLDDVLARRPRLLAVAVEPREPGNAGTLIRAADAMGADAVLLLGDAVDPHNGKCVRASAGSVFHLPIARQRDIVGTLRSLQHAGIALLATAADGELTLDRADGVLSGAVAWLFGNEAHGLPAEIAATADHRVSIPLRGRAESLNLAAAAAICLYESARVQAATG